MAYPRYALGNYYDQLRRGKEFVDLFEECGMEFMLAIICRAEEVTFASFTADLVEKLRKGIDGEMHHVFNRVHNCTVDDAMKEFRKILGDVAVPEPRTDSVFPTRYMEGYLIDKMVVPYKTFEESGLGAIVAGRPEVRGKFRMAYYITREQKLEVLAGHHGQVGGN